MLDEIESSIRGNEMSGETREKAKEAREGGDIQTQIDVLLDAIGVIDEDENGYYYILNPELHDTENTEVVEEDGVRKLTEQ